MYGLFRMSIGELESFAEQAYACGATATCYRIMAEIDQRNRRVSA